MKEYSEWLDTPAWFLLLCYCSWYHIYRVITQHIGRQECMGKGYMLQESVTTLHFLVRCCVCCHINAAAATALSSSGKDSEKCCHVAIPSWAPFFVPRFTCFFPSPLSSSSTFVSYSITLISYLIICVSSYCGDNHDGPLLRVLFYLFSSLFLPSYFYSTSFSSYYTLIPYLIICFLVLWK